MRKKHMFYYKIVIFNKKNVIITNNSNVINIYCVYKLDPISTSRDDTFSLQMLYLELYKLLKMLILVNISTKDMVFVSMEIHCLA